MKELNANQLENLEGGKFWGSTNTQTLDSSGMYYCTHRYEVFGITTNFDSWYSSVPCVF